MKLVPGEGEVVADPCACSATQQTSCCSSTLRERGFEKRKGFLGLQAGRGRSRGS